MIKNRLFLMILSISQIHYSRSFIPYSWSSKTVRPVQNKIMQKTFEILKHKRNIDPNYILNQYHPLVPIAWYVAASHSGAHKAITLSPTIIITKTKSQQLFTLQHELSHALQYSDCSWQKGNTWIEQYLDARPDSSIQHPVTYNTWYVLLRKAKEYDADKKACEQMVCPTCLMIQNLDISFVDRTARNFPQYFFDLGYFSEKDYERYILDRLQKNQYCKVHDTEQCRWITQQLAHKPIVPLRFIYHKYLKGYDRFKGTILDRLETKEEGK